MPDGLALIQSAGDDVTFIMPESDVLLTGRFVENPPEPVVYTITYHSGLEPGDEGYTAALGESHDFPVTARSITRCLSTIPMSCDTFARVIPLRAGS